MCATYVFSIMKTIELKTIALENLERKVHDQITKEVQPPNFRNEIRTLQQSNLVRNRVIIDCFDFDYQ